MPPAPATDEHLERRRVLIGNLVFRRIAYRSLVRTAFPFCTVLYGVALALATVAWNVAALDGWSPPEEGLVVFTAAVAAGFVVVPLGVLAALGLGCLYNTVSHWTGGLEIAVVAQRRGHHRHHDH